jgi:hypothetical protein
MYTIKEFTKMLQENNMNILKQKNLGFGPFTIFNKNVLSDGLGIMLHKKLQYLSDREYPIIRKTGCQYIVLAEKKSKWKIPFQ